MASSSAASGSGAPSSTSTYSPRGSTSAHRSTAPARLPRHTSSWSLVSSRASATRRVGATGRDAGRRGCGPGGAAPRRARPCGARRPPPASRSVRPEPLRGRKPSNTNRPVGRPLATRPASAADGPGHDLDDVARGRRPPPPGARPGRRCRACRRRSPRPPARPGRGGPARRPPPRPRCGRSPRAAPGARTPMWASSRPVRRVSSQATTSARPSSSTARGDRSPRLPIGVPTSTRAPLTGAPAGRRRRTPQRAKAPASHSITPRARQHRRARGGWAPWCVTRRTAQVGVDEGHVDGEAHAEGVHRARPGAAAGRRRCRHGRAGPVRRSRRVVGDLEGGQHLLVAHQPLRRRARRFGHGGMLRARRAPWNHGRHGGIAGSDVEAELHDVAVGDLVVLALDPEDARRRGPSTRSRPRAARPSG